MEKTKVCVTGGSGYIGSWLVKKLLEKGYIVHATLRSLDDTIKVGLCKSLPNADAGLLLFKADIYNPDEFEAAIEGCHYVFHVATPMLHTLSSQYKDTIEAAISGVRTIADCCLRSQTVKRLIYTGSVMASSPLKDDGTGFKYSLDESCWTPLINYSFTYANDFLRAYTASKTLAEKEILSYNKRGKNLEVVSLCCALVGGDTHLSYVPVSVDVILSPLRGNHLSTYTSLQFLQELLGSIPLVHIEDVCDAHIFCMEKSSLRGRYLCSDGDPTLGEIEGYYREKYPEFDIPQGLMGGQERESKCNSMELIKQGFEYKFSMTDILDDSVGCGRRLRVLYPK